GRKMRLRRPAPRSAASSLVDLHLLDGTTFTVRASHRDVTRLLTNSDLLRVTNHEGTRRLIVVANIAWAEQRPDEQGTNDQVAGHRPAPATAFRRQANRRPR